MASPYDPPELTDAPNPAVARALVNLPAIFLMVVGGLGVLLAIFNLIFGSQSLPDEFYSTPELQQYRGTIEAVSAGAGRFGQLVTLAISGLVVFGAVKMRNLESWGLAMTAAIVAMIPCLGPCCCLGLPVGIWALVVLNKPEVRTAFR